jgi:hypothetical protein
MATVTFFNCPKCREPLDVRQGRLKNACLVVECPKCGAEVQLESGVACRVCGAPATQFEIRGLSPVSVLYYCDRHLDTTWELRKAARNKFLAFVLPIIGTALIVLSFFDKSKPGRLFLPFIFIGILCRGSAIGLWMKRRPDTRGGSASD